MSAESTVKKNGSMLSLFLDPQRYIALWSNGINIDTLDRVFQEHGKEKRLSIALRFKDVVEEYLVAPHHR